MNLRCCGHNIYSRKSLSQHCCITERQLNLHVTMESCHGGILCGLLLFSCSTLSKMEDLGTGQSNSLKVNTSSPVEEVLTYNVLHRCTVAYMLKIVKKDDNYFCLFYG